MIKTLFTTLPNGVVPFFDPATIDGRIVDLQADELPDLYAIGDPIVTFPNQPGLSGGAANWDFIAPPPRYFQQTDPNGNSVPIWYSNRFEGGVGTRLRGSMPLLATTNGFAYYAWFKTLQVANNLAGEMFADTTRGCGIGWRDLLGTHDVGLVAPFASVNEWVSVCFNFPGPGDGSQQGEVYINGALVGRAAWSWANNDLFYYVGGATVSIEAQFRRMIYYQGAHSAAQRMGVLNWGQANYGYGAA
jgi:hypothetical protein